MVPDGAPHELVHWYTTGCIHGDVVISLLFPMIHVFMHLSDSTWHSTPQIAHDVFSDILSGGVT